MKRACKTFQRKDSVGCQNPTVMNKKSNGEFLPNRISCVKAVLLLVLFLSALAGHPNCQASCVTPLTGMVGWWQGEDSAADGYGSNHGVLQGTIGYAAGKVGRALLFNTTNADVKIPASLTLDVGAGSGFTLEAWIYPTNTNTRRPLFEWNNGTTGWGVHFWIDPGQGGGAGSLYANIVDTGFFWHQFHSPGGKVLAGVFQHVALTYDKSLGLATMYCNGVMVAQSALGSFTPLTSFDLYLGRRLAGASGDVATFSGMIDEPTIYNHALTASEIASINNVGSLGKCGLTLPRTATANAFVASGLVVSNIVTDGGWGYTNLPTVRFIGGGGFGASADAVLSNGVVIAIIMNNAGSGYTNSPLVVVSPPYSVASVLTIVPATGLVFSNLNIGTVYQLQKPVEWYWLNQSASFIASSSVTTQFVSSAGAKGYRLVTSPAPSQAFATAQVVNGFVVGATVTNGGSGYVTNPAVTIVGGGGFNATAVVSGIFRGSVGGITMINAGSGYSSVPTVRIDPPPVAALFPSSRPVMRMDLANLLPYDNYQLQYRANISSAWTDWNGGLFSSVTVTNSQFLFIHDSQSFFRVQHLP